MGVGRGGRPPARGTRPRGGTGRGTGPGRGAAPRRGFLVGEPPARGPRALLYLAGAALIAAGVSSGTLDLPRTALAVAAILVLVGLAGGLADGPWGAALVVAGAGAGALLAPELRSGPGGLDLATETVAGLGAGLGLLCVVPLVLTGRPWGSAATVLAVAAVLGVLTDDVDVPALQRPGTWAGLLFLLGAVNLLLWARDREPAPAGPRR